MLNMSYNMNILKHVFVILCSFCGNMLRYQNMKYLFWIETGGAFTFGMQMMQLFSENKADFTELMGTLGRYFQIWDDYCDVGLQEVTLSYQL